MRILLMGNPNVGKSVIFSRLTGANVIASNYPGTTVEYAKGKLKLDAESAEVVDVPGTYGLQATSRAEEVAVQMLRSGTLVVDIVDATCLERNLNLTLQLLATDKPVVIVLNMWDEAVAKGITIDVQKLEELLGVPVVATCALSGEGLFELKERLPDAHAGTRRFEEQSKWRTITDILEKVQRVAHRHPTLGGKLAHATVHPISGPFVALLVLIASFEVIRQVGEGLIRYVLEPLFETAWLPLVTRLSGLLGGSGIPRASSSRSPPSCPIFLDSIWCFAFWKTWVTCLGWASWWTT